MVSNMKIERMKKEITQIDLWMITDIPQWRLSLIERGIHPREDEAIKIAEALEQDVKFLFPQSFEHSHTE